MFRRSVAILVVIAVQANGAALAEVTKRSMPAFPTPACQQIEASAARFAVEKVRRATRYFTPIFQSGPDGGLRAADRRNCLNIEGSCIVGSYLYNVGRNPAGSRYELDKVSFTFGKGSGVDDYNRTNALVPCRTVAADLSRYKVGTVLFVPSFKNKTCPQNGQPIDGCFIVGDKGGAIKGKGRFDLFTGECASYDGKKHECRDPGNAAFQIPAGTEFYVVPRDAALAHALRDQVDAFVENGWRPPADTAAR